MKIYCPLFISTKISVRNEVSSYKEASTHFLMGVTGSVYSFHLFPGRPNALCPSTSPPHFLVQAVLGVWAGTVLGNWPSLLLMTSNASLKFSLRTKKYSHLLNWVRTVTSQHPRLRLSSFLCQLWMSRWLAMTQQQDCGNCGWSAEMLLEDSGCLWCGAHWEWACLNFKQWNNLQRKVLWECCPAALVECLAVPPVPVEWQHQGWRFEWWPRPSADGARWAGLEESTERVFSAFILGV